MGRVPPVGFPISTIELWYMWAGHATFSYTWLRSLTSSAIASGEIFLHIAGDHWSMPTAVDLFNCFDPSNNHFFRYLAKRLSITPDCFDHLMHLVPKNLMFIIFRLPPECPPLFKVYLGYFMGMSNIFVVYPHMCWQWGGALGSPRVKACAFLYP